MNTPDQKYPSMAPTLHLKTERAITAFAELCDALPEGDDRNDAVEKIAALIVEH
jgi:cytochrome c-type biogenesis protein CcmH/NrfG